MDAVVRADAAAMVDGAADQADEAVKVDAVDGVAGGGQGDSKPGGNNRHDDNDDNDDSDHVYNGQADSGAEAAVPAGGEDAAG